MFQVRVDAHCPAPEWARRGITKFQGKRVSIARQEDGRYTATCEGASTSHHPTIKQACEWVLTDLADVQMNVTTIRNVQ